MDNEKQIEEVAIRLCGIADNKDIMITPNTYSLIGWSKIAKELLKHHQLADKDSVILSKEEYRSLQNLLTKRQNVIDSYRKCIDKRNSALKQANKKTAREFYDKFNENICYFTLEDKSEDYKDGYVQAIADICGKLDETAIELGVDLKEYYGK